jgi:hypothetical protein
MTGISSSHSGGREAAVECLELFLSKYPLQYPSASFQDLPVDVVCSQALWRGWASFVVFEHVSISTDRPLAHGTVKGYLQKVMATCKEKFEKDPAGQVFFKDLEKENNWWDKMLDKVREEIEKYMREMGEKLKVRSAPPITGAMMDAVVNALMKKNTPSSLQDGFSLHNIRNGGMRAGETTESHWTDIEQSLTSSFPTFDVNAEKTGRLKPCAILPGATHLRCSYTRFGDCAISEGFNLDKQSSSNGLTRRLFPRTGRGAEFVTDILKALKRGEVPELPEGSTSHGIRRAAFNEVVDGGILLSEAVAFSGHAPATGDGNNQSVLWDYFVFSGQKTVYAVALLSGFPASFSGRLRRAPLPPSLSPIEQAPGASPPSQLDLLIDNV